MGFKHSFKRPNICFAFILLIILLFIMPANADWRADLGTFRIGIVNAELQKLSPLERERIRNAYADALKMPVEIIQMQDFPALIDAQASSRVEYAIYSATAYATVWLACECVEPLVAPVNFDGSTGVRAALFLRDGQSLKTMETSKGIAIAGQDSMPAFGLALSEFTALHGPIKGSEPWLKIQPDVSTVVSTYLNHDIDGFFAVIPQNRTLATALLTKDRVAIAMGADVPNLKAVWISDVVPNGPHVVRRNINPEAKQAVTTFLITLAAKDPELFDLIAPDNAINFVKISHSDYAAAISATKALAAYSKK